MTNEKTCPKCPGSPPMKNSNIESLLVATLTPEFNQSDSAVSKRAGVPVMIYTCPRCNLVELYYSPQ
jgi:hypothetical protein